MHRLLTTIISSAIMAALSSCGNHVSTSSSDSDTTSVADRQSTNLAQPPMLPDTAYESVKALRAVTEIGDTSTSGTIDFTGNMYADAPGIFTFRGGAYRNADFHGSVKGEPTKIAVDWEFKTDNSLSSEKWGSWGGGSGWTGQPLYVEWPDSCIARFKKAGTILPEFGKREIIVGSLAGHVYFINFDNGKASRRSINQTNPIKGTISLDPTLNGNLYVGQGIPQQRPFGALVIDLYRHAVSHTFGEDSRAPRHWGAYDSSALRVGQFLFRPGENGSLYKFTVKPGSLKLHSTMRYTTAKNQLGMEASMSQYSNYGYTADNEGNLVCTNLNTMRPVWRFDMGDDTDSSPVLIVENGHPYIYTGCEIDKQGAGNATFAKVDGLTGKAVWTTKFEGRLAEVGTKHFDGGFYGTALPGRGDCEDLIFANVVRNLRGQNGEFVAMERATGRVRYTTPLKYYAWSSPVGFINDAGKQYIVTGDCAGRIYLIRGADGRIIYSAPVGHNFESSPVVVGNSFVVGSRGNTIFKMSLQ